MRDDDQPAAEQLDRYWDSLVAGRNAEVTNDLHETVRWLHAVRPERPDPGFVNHLEKTLMETTSTRTARRPRTPMLPGRANRIALLSRTTGPDAPAPRRRTDFLPIAFLVLAIVLTAAGLGNGAWRGRLFTSSPDNQRSGGFTAQPSGTPVPEAPPPLPIAIDGGNAARTGVVDAAGPDGAATVAWRLPVTFPAGLIVAGDRAFYYAIDASSKDHELTAVDLTNGVVLWSASVTLPVFFGVPTVAHGLVYVTTPIGVTTFDAATGATVWTQDLGVGPNTPSLPIANGLLFVTARDKTVRALDAATGEERWRVSIPDSLQPDTQPMEMLSSTASPAVADGVVYTMGNGGLILASEAGDGHQLWTFQTAGSLGRGVRMAADGVVIVEMENGGDHRVQAVDAKTGSLLWQREGDEAGDSAAIQDGILYLSGTGTEGRELAAVNLADGTVIWTIPTSGRAAGIGLANGVLYLAAGGRVEGIDLATRSSAFSAEFGSVGYAGIRNGLLVVSTIDAILGVAAIPVAGTPTAASPPVDLSGLPACIQPRDVPAFDAEGTPAATIEVESKVVGPTVPGSIAQVLTENLPAGEPASAAEIAGIQQTLNRLNDCVMGRTSENQTIDGFFSDDFFRRGWGAGAGPGPGEIGPGWPSAISGDPPTIAQTVSLPDGRVLAVLDFGGGYDQLVIFVEDHGAWLVDERYLIVDEYKAPHG